MSTEAKLDPNIGRDVVREGDNCAGTISGAAGTSYVIQWSDGTQGMCSMASYRAADKAHVKDVARRGTLKRTGNVREDARAAYARIEAIRNGEEGFAARAGNAAILRNARSQRDPNAPMTDVDRQRILSRVASAPAVPVSAADAQRIRNRLAGKPETTAPDFKSEVQAHVVQLTKHRRKH